MATLAVAAGDLNPESDNQQAGAGEPVRASPRTVRNRRNREAQQRKHLVKKADLLGKLWPQTNIAVFTWSPQELSAQSAVSGPELGQPPVAKALAALVDGLVRGLKGGSLEAPFPLELSGTLPQQAVWALYKRGNLPKATLEDSLETLNKLVKIDEDDEDGPDHFMPDIDTSMDVSESMDSIESSECAGLHASPGEEAASMSCSEADSPQHDGPVDSGDGLVLDVEGTMHISESGPEDVCAPAGTSVEMVLNVIWQLTIWTQRENILGAWEDGSLLFTRETMSLCSYWALQEFTPTEGYILDWLCAQLEVCREDEDLRCELQTASAHARMRVHNASRPLKRLVRGSQLKDKADPEGMRPQQEQQPPQQSGRSLEAAAMQLDQENVPPCNTMQPHGNKSLGLTGEQDEFLKDFWTNNTKGPVNKMAAAALLEKHGKVLSTTQLAHAKERLFGTRKAKKRQKLADVPEAAASPPHVSKHQVDELLERVDAMLTYAEEDTDKETPQIAAGAPSGGAQSLISQLDALRKTDGVAKVHIKRLKAATMQLRLALDS